jgi:hypothetical protein
MKGLVSHAGPWRLRRWNNVQRQSVHFDDLVLAARYVPHRLESWFADIVGTPWGRCRICQEERGVRIGVSMHLCCLL